MKKKLIFAILVLISMILSGNIINYVDLAFDNMQGSSNDKRGSENCERPNKEIDLRCKSFSWTLKNPKESTYLIKSIDSASDGYQYAWELIDYDGKTIFKLPFSDSNTLLYSFHKEYPVLIKAFCKDKNGTTISKKITSLELFCKPFSVEIEKINKENIRNMLCKESGLANCSIMTANEVIRGNGAKFNTKITIPVDWKFPGVYRGTAGKMNGFMFLDDLYFEYLQTDNQEYALTIVNYMIDWIIQHPEVDISDEYAWHDDRTAVRMIRMSLYYDTFYELLTEDQKNIIRESIMKQAELLLDPDFYTENHNHGMHQDLALIAYAVFVENNTQKQKEIIEKALERSRWYFDYVYTSDGIHKEHSPHYAIDCMGYLDFYREMTKGCCSEYYTVFNNYYDKAIDYFSNIIKPNGLSPELGDSLIFSIEDCNSKGMFSENICDSKRIKNDCIFMEGGYAIMRSDDNNTYLLLNASTHSSTHKHSDDLEILLYHKGDLFVEAGSKDYDYTDELTQYSYSGFAHNVLIVDGETFPVKIGKNGSQSIYPDALNTIIKSYEQNGNLSKVSAIQTRYEGITQERTIEYNRDKNTIEIIDNIESDRSFIGDLLFHVSPEVTINTDDKIIYFLRDAEIASMTVNSNSNTSFEFIEDEGKKPYYNYMFSRGNKIIGKLLIIHFEGNHGDTEIRSVVYLK